MVYPPGQGKSGQQLMQLWRDYLEEYADRDGDVEGQTIVAAYHVVAALTALARTLDTENFYKELIDKRISYFNEGSRRAGNFIDCLINATFSIYNTLNTLCHQFSQGNAQVSALMGKIDEQVHLSVEAGGGIERPAAALRSCFPLLSLLTITLDQDQAMTRAIRQVEQRFAEGAKAASSDWEHMLNALYRIVEMTQIMALLTDAELRDQINQIASRFKEEDQPRELRLKLRNGFCRLFELSHLLITHIDAMV
jgi:hypothetical protein